jgi:hypothetical protein
MAQRSHLLRSVLLAGAVALTGCPKARIDCFDVTSRKNSPQTRALFQERQCQGGGVTWGPILHVLARRVGPFEEVPDPGPGWTGGVYAMLGVSRFSIDDEGDAARVCADDARLLARLRGEYEKANGDVEALRRAMNEAPAYQMECREADGSPARIPKLEMFPVPTPPR